MEIPWNPISFKIGISLSTQLWCNIKDGSTKLKKWQKAKLSWSEKTDLIKSFILPHYIFLFLGTPKRHTIENF